MSERTKRELNEYLFYEFGEDGDPADVADDWPFELRPVGRFAVSGGETEVFEFTANEERTSR